MRELSGVFCMDFDEKLPHYNGTALYFRKPLQAIRKIKSFSCYLKYGKDRRKIKLDRMKGELHITNCTKMQTVVNFKTHTKATLLGWGGGAGGMEVGVGGEEVGVGGWVFYWPSFDSSSENARNKEPGVLICLKNLLDR